MPTIVATAGATNANSYCTLVEANTYHESHLYATTWTDGEDDNKIIALIWATRLLDEQYDWVGQKVSSDQALRWPRADVTDRDGWEVSSTTIPQFLKNATAELARQLMTSDRFGTRDSAAAGIKSVQAGSVAVEFDSLDRIEVFPEAVESMVSFYTTGSQLGGIEVPLVRV